VKNNGKATDHLVKIWVDNLLQSPNHLLKLPLSNDFKSPWGVNVLSDFLSKELPITLSEARHRKHLTMPLIEKMAEMQIIVEEASSRENLIRQRILDWYSNLSFDDKKNLPRLALYPSNICFKSIGSEQRSWASLSTQYEWIAEVIDYIHEDLHNLGIISADFKTIKSRKRAIKDAKSVISQWVSTISDDIDAMWDIPVTKANTDLGFNVAIEHIQTVLGISESSANNYRELAYPLTQKMIEKGILVYPKGNSGAGAVESRRKLLNWYRKLNLKEKSQLPIFGNKISLGKMHTKQSPITQSDLRFDIVKDAWDFIHKDLEKLGLLNTNYKSVSERNHERKKLLDIPRETMKERFNRLATLKLNSVLDFIEPSELEPFIQIEQLFASQMKTLPSNSGRSNYTNACGLFVEFLSELYGSSPLRIIDTFDEYLLSKYRSYLEDKIIQNNISSHHANTILSSVRMTFNRLTKVKNLEYSFFDVQGFDVHRQTDTKKPFSKNERIQILEAIEKAISETQLSLEPYKKTGIGINPLDQHGNRIKGLSNLDNARWLFENFLDCKPVHHNTAKTHIEKAFLSIIKDSKKGLNEVYEEWGVTPMIGIDLLVPYILRLAQVTGLNTDSILSLDIKDFETRHPATSRPCLRYWKERSDGYKEYHLDLIKAKITWLTESQSSSVKEIFKQVIQMTSCIRENIEDSMIKDRLFIYQSNSTKKHGQISSLLGTNEKNASPLGHSIARFIDKYQLKNDHGQPIILTISRFRPSFVSEMLEADVPINEIQLMLGHSSLHTTIGYIDSLDFNSISRKRLNEKLMEIHQSTLNSRSEEKIKTIEIKNEEELGVTFKTNLAACRNIFDPPDFVKKMASYTPGTPCSQYNKCLSCDNVIITANYLPELFAMKRDYLAILENSRVMDTPYGKIIKENLELLSYITDPETSDFSKEELEIGKNRSNYLGSTITIDGVV
jgi:integrase